MKVLRSMSGSVLLLLLFLLPAGCLQAENFPCNGKKVIGQECWVHVKEIDLDFLARVDTGATSTSLHATDFLIAGGTDDPRDNVGRSINFLTVSTAGEYKRMTAEIAGIQTVVNAQGREKRYTVWLTLAVDGVTKTVQANLRDRSDMKYKLLIGRDWLTDDFLVDISRETSIVAEEGEEEDPFNQCIISRTPDIPAF